MHPSHRVVIVSTTVLLLAALAAPAGATAPFEPAAEAARRCVTHSDLGAADATPSASLRAAVDTALADERLTGVGLGLSLWVEGFGEIEAVNPELRLRPASNQKLLTAMGALEVLGPDHVFTTKVRVVGPVDDGVLDGDLYLVGGGDPSLAFTGPGSLETLAASVRAAGITDVRGTVYADESRYDDLRRANGWSSSVAPAWVGSLSALTVDENRYRADAPFLADPARYNAAQFVELLGAAGVGVNGGVAAAKVPPGATIIAQIESPPLRSLLVEVLRESNNTYAELLVKEIGRARHAQGTTATGLAVIADALAMFCLPETILQQDGSGLSHGNARSTRSWRQFLQAAQARPWWSHFVAALPVAAESGTIENRFVETEAAGNLRAKTGTITGLRSLSGLLTTAGGRRVFFSAVVDDDNPRPAMAAIDALLVSVAADES